MYKRSYIDEDPYVNIGDHPIDVMYAELVKTHGGMDVFIKTSSSGRSGEWMFTEFIDSFGGNKK